MENIADQRLLWEAQHAIRGSVVESGSSLKFTPNETAVVFAKYLPHCSKIFEVGPGNGRDARYWASIGHEVTVADFSITALRQLKEIASEQGVAGKISSVVWDINVGCLPFNRKTSIDAFYARSALHVDDETMWLLANNIDEILVRNGVILIEGKGLNDKKISRSVQLGNGIAIDYEEGGHARRVWTTEFMKVMCDRFNWDIINLTDSHEEWQGIPATFIRLIAKKH